MRKKTTSRTTSTLCKSLLETSLWRLWPHETKTQSVQTLMACKLRPSNLNLRGNRNRNRNRKRKRKEKEKKRMPLVKDDPFRKLDLANLPARPLGKLAQHVQCHRSLPSD